MTPRNWEKQEVSFLRASGGGDSGDLVARNVEIGDCTLGGDQMKRLRTGI